MNLVKAILSTTHDVMEECILGGCQKLLAKDLVFPGVEWNYIKLPENVQ